MSKHTSHILAACARLEEITSDPAWLRQEIGAIESLLLAKHADYGGSVYKPPELKPSLGIGDALLVRMSDKIARIRNLVETNRLNVNDESLQQTWLDLAGYCLLALAMPGQGRAEGG